MNNKMLFPHSYRKIGLTLTLIFLPLMLASLFFEFSFNFLGFEKENESVINLSDQNFSNEIFGIGCILGVMFIAFSKEKFEDEFYNNLRLNALLWAIYVNYGLILISICFFHGLSFMYVMIFNMLTPLLIFLIRYKYQVWKAQKDLKLDLNAE